MILKRSAFFTNTKSAKASQIELNNKIGANFIFRYEDYFRQIRITGYADACDTKHADDYFATRSRGSQIGAWASNQSEKIYDRSTLDRQYNYYENKFKDKTVPSRKIGLVIILSQTKLNFGNLENIGCMIVLFMKELRIKLHG